MRRIALIARREFLAYASAPSFWVALAMGPLLMALAAFALSALGKPAPAPRPDAVAIEAQDAAVAARAAASIAEAGRLEHHPFRVAAGPNAKAATTVRLSRGPDGAVSVAVEGGRLSEVTLALLRRDLAAISPSGQGRAVQVVQPPPPSPPPRDLARFGRFSITVLLWLVLVGSLGMLLQAVVRERSNRALESLLSSVRPLELVFGKLIGVGALSIVVVATWLAGGAVVAGTSASGVGLAGALFAGVASVGYLAGALGLFVLAYAMYGVALIGIGALARDVPAAQNLSRPVFGLLLLVFFVALSQVAGMGEGTLKGLVLVPPFTPFVLLLARPGALQPFSLAVGLAGMVATTAALAWLGSLALRGERPFKRRRAAQLAPQA